jgi:hypothetical protein
VIELAHHPGDAAVLPGPSRLLRAWQSARAGPGLRVIAFTEKHPPIFAAILQAQAPVVAGKEGRRPTRPRVGVVDDAAGCEIGEKHVADEGPVGTCLRARALSGADGVRVAAFVRLRQPPKGLST